MTTSAGAGLISLIYASSACRMLQPRELDDLLVVSRANNAPIGVTGMLLYRGGNFLQVLEGEESVVMQLKERIARDTRHHGVLVIWKGGIAHRQFADWSMAFANLDSDCGERPDGYSDFLRESVMQPARIESASTAWRLLESFRRNIR